MSKPNSVNPPSETRNECHRLVDAMPDNGVEEMVQSLRDMMEFYSMPEYIPPPKTHDVIIHGRIVESVKTKPFKFDWEEDCNDQAP